MCGADVKGRVTYQGKNISLITQFCSLFCRFIQAQLADEAADPVERPEPKRPDLRFSLVRPPLK